MSRPASITVVGILELISGILNLLDCLGLLLIGGFVGGICLLSGSQEGFAIAAIFGSFMLLFAFISLTLGLLSLILSIGLFRLHKWAWVGATIVHSITLIVEVTKLAGSGGVAANYLNLGFAIAIFYYLMQPDVKQAFRV
ncbi:hypothetical protein [Oscillatoria sp. FACHB-1406]|uniref:hypothetical protein n=1 Tax=Oscillatoria sp. FACHB-1406 TaxID=2692846 RepID=UPI00168761D9|nr:hypothetical protein [Oscillatoria sp. FACHB-1406]MBD2578481.1 hypothetical protein [Oscillatoria sp. FACHB-1406]